MKELRINFIYAKVVIISFDYKGGLRENCA